MPVEVISNLYLNYGLIGLVVISLFVLIVWTIRKSEERETKLHAIIEKLSAELPEIRQSLLRIERNTER